MNSWGKVVLTSCSVFIGLTALCSSASAQKVPMRKHAKIDHPGPGIQRLGCIPPANDDCSTPTIVGLGANAFDSTCSSGQLSDPTCVSTPDATVWFAFTALTNNIHNADTCGSTFDTTLGIYTAPTSCGPYTEVTCNDDGPVCIPQSEVSWCAVAGTTYYIMIDGFFTEQGPGTLTITDTGTGCTPPTSPANDHCDNATVLTGPFPQTGTEDTTAADAAGDPASACGFNNTHSVWFSYTATGNDTATFETCTSDYDTVVSVWTGACGSLSEVVCNDDDFGACGPPQSHVEWLMTSGTTYLIALAGYSSNSGNAGYRFDVVPTAPPPANDHCASATVLMAPFPVSGSENTSGADSAGDPVSACGLGNGHSVWFAYTATGNGTATFSACGSDYDTVASVWTGACGSLTEVACDDDSFDVCGGLQSNVTWPITSGTTYSIMLQGYGTNSGSLSYTFDTLTESTLCRAGNINGLSGPVTDTLFINGSVGSLPDRIVNITPATPFTMHIDPAPSGGRRYAMYLWVGQPNDATVRTAPFSIGMTCMPTPLNPGPPQPHFRANNIGHTAQLGTENWPGPATQPAPYDLLNLPGGVGRTGTFFVQGIEIDSQSPNGRAGVTNGIVIVSM
jgi:hypothetical protein